MRIRLSGFRDFVAEDMDQTPEKRRDPSGEEDTGQEDYFAALGDEFGMEFSDIKSAVESEPWVSSHFPLGSPGKEVMYKQSAWEIVPGSLGPNGADIRLKPQTGNRSYLKGNRLNKSKTGDERRYHLSREELQKFLTTGWTPPPQQDPMAAGGMPGMPAQPPMM